LLVAGVSQAWALHFDDSGAVPDSTYTATLTFTNADEPLPGATAQASLVVALRAGSSERRRTGPRRLRARRACTRLAEPADREGTRLR
jgi:hypothetical protein